MRCRDENTNHSDKIWNKLRIRFDSQLTLNPQSMTQKNTFYCACEVFCWNLLVFSFILVNQTRCDAVAHSWLVLIPYEHVYTLQSKDDKND